MEYLITFLVLWGVLSFIVFIYREFFKPEPKCEVDASTGMPEAVIRDEK
jgi:hypothetical protein